MLYSYYEPNYKKRESRKLLPLQIFDNFLKYNIYPEFIEYKKICMKFYPQFYNEKFQEKYILILDELEKFPYYEI